MKIVLIGNYEPDSQESMQRFSSLLELQLRTLGVTVEVIKPGVILGRWSTGGQFVDKWFGYVDKFLLFPWRLRRLAARYRARREAVLFHICDHSNAVYVSDLDGCRVLVTCHDLLAVRSALGEFHENPTGRLGRYLQSRILKGLSMAPCVASVSEATRADLARLTFSSLTKSVVISNGPNFPYRRISSEQAIGFVRTALIKAGVAPERSERLLASPYLLHVGGNQWYKNRTGLLQIYRRLSLLMPRVPNLILVGKPLTQAQALWIEEHGLSECVVALTTIDNESLCALYSMATLFLFPSLAEGFGWPILEAQSCGCPVVTSEYAPMPEVGGQGAFYCNPRNYSEAARLIQRALAADAAAIQAMRERCADNVRRFTAEAMTGAYLSLYQTLLNS